MCTFLECKVKYVVCSMQRTLVFLTQIKKKVSAYRIPVVISFFFVFFFGGGDKI